MARPEVSGRYDACGKLYSVPSQTVTVAGIGADGWPGLSPLSKAAVEQAEVVIGSPRQLALLPPTAGGERIPLPSPLLPGLQDLIQEHARAAVVVLASGDPMFYGIGSTLVRLLGPDRVRVLPHPVIRVAGRRAARLAAGRRGRGEPGRPSP